MKEKIDFITKNLRQQAEEILKHKVYNQVGTLSEADSLKLMHEMEVYQIELDMQNDELQRTKAVDAKRMKLVHELNVHKLELEMQNDEIERARMAAEEIAKKYSILYDFAPTGYFTLSDVGDILGLNLSGAQMLNREVKVNKL